MMQINHVRGHCQKSLPFNYDFVAVQRKQIAPHYSFTKINDIDFKNGLNSSPMKPIQIISAIC